MRYFELKKKIISSLSDGGIIDTEVSKMFFDGLVSEALAIRVMREYIRDIFKECQTGHKLSGYMDESMFTHLGGSYVQNVSTSGESCRGKEGTLG